MRRTHYDTLNGGFLAGVSWLLRNFCVVTSVPDWFVVIAHHHVLSSAVALIANDGIVLSAIALIGAAWLHRNRPALLIPFLIGAIVASVLDLVAGRAYHELRPFVVMHASPLVPHDALDNSFPSDHAVATAYVASFLFFVDVRWAALATLAALLVGLARIGALLHWPGDVLTGWAIGVWCGAVAGVLAPKDARP